MSWFYDCKKAAAALSVEKKQEFLDLIHQGESIGNSRAACGISFEAANGIIQAHMEENKFITLRRTAKQGT